MSDSETIHEGGCQCGRIRYRVTGRPNNTTNCHCTQCRMAGGAAFVTWSEFPRAHVHFMADEPHTYRSSDRAERGFCPWCGTTLTFHYLDSDTIDLATATFDDPAEFPPQDHLWIDSKISWLVIADGLPQYPRERA